VDQETQSEKISSMDKTALELIRKIEEGDHDALMLLYDKTSRLLFGLILRVLGNQTRAEEMLLEAYTVVWKQSTTYDGGITPLAWLITIARSRAIAGLHEDKKNRRKRQSPPATSEPAITVIPELQTLARRSWQSLHPVQREILDWAYYGGLSCSEIAAQIIKPIGAIKTHARIGLSKLVERFCLQQDAPVESSDMTQEVHSDVRELAPFFAIGSLSQQETRSFEMHLHDGCALCEQELRKFEHAAAAIGFACDEADTPEYVRDLLLARIEHEPQAHPPALTENTLENAAVVKNLRQKPELFSRPQSSGIPKLPWVIALICALLGAFAFYSWKSLQTTHRELQEQASTAKTEIRVLKQKLEIQQNKAEEPSPLMEMAVRQGIRIARMKGQPATPANAGTIFWDPQKGQCLILGSFTPLPPGKTYHIWFSTSTTKIYIGPLNADTKGNIATTISDIPKIESAMSAIITMESEQVSLLPAGPYCATGRID
jgi:RNA polymerase sigma-70 factor, ECF subfamily